MRSNVPNLSTSLPAAASHFFLVGALEVSFQPLGFLTAMFYFSAKRL
jgi:hypothetical protein